MSSPEAQPMPGHGSPDRGPLHVLIMGMHRSGTSALAEALRSAGMYGGEGEITHGARADNPRGFGELARIVHFNDRLLATLGSAWDCPPPVPYSLQNPPERLPQV